MVIVRDCCASEMERACTCSSNTMPMDSSAIATITSSNEKARRRITSVLLHLGDARLFVLDRHFAGEGGDPDGERALPFVVIGERDERLFREAAGEEVQAHLAALHRV